MSRAILAFNAGSSNIKFAVFAVAGNATLSRLLYRGLVDYCFGKLHFVVTDGDGRPITDAAIEPGPQRESVTREMLSRAVAWLAEHTRGLDLVGAGHRVVHGGQGFAASTRVDDRLIAALEKLMPLDPPSLAQCLDAIRALESATPGLPQVACFDSAFYRTGPRVAHAVPLPREILDAGLEGYGFHGLSYEYIAHALPALLEGRAEGRIVVAHLGNESSMCAMKQRKHMANTADFSALESLPMGTRCGTLDPGAIFYLMRDRGMNLDEIARLLYHQSGLLGVSGVSSDLRELLQSSSPEAAQAIEFFVYRVGRELGSLAAALQGLDALVFTGGIGEHAASVRAAVCREAGWLGITLDEAANLRHGPRISAPQSPVSAWVIPMDEELIIARHALEVLHDGIVSSSPK
jgi:acetate kinase